MHGEIFGSTLTSGWHGVEVGVVAMEDLSGPPSESLDEGPDESSPELNIFSIE
jgi:hypothetical protein